MGGANVNTVLLLTFHLKLEVFPLENFASGESK